MTELDDDTLIALIKKRDTHAEALLCAKYWVFAKNLAKKFYSLYSDLGLTLDDFTGVAFSSIMIAIQKYNPAEHDSFHAYWLIISKNQCINYIRENSYLSFSETRPVSLDSMTMDGGLTLHETCGDYDHRIKYDILFKHLHDYIFSPKSSLTDDERVVAYYMILYSYSYQDMLNLTKWSRSKLYRVAINMRKKVSNFLKVIL